jgi:hypothetical protein
MRRAEGRAFRVRRNATTSDAIWFLRDWLCALPDEQTEWRPACLSAHAWQLTLRRTFHAHPFRPPGRGRERENVLHTATAISRFSCRSTRLIVLSRLQLLL